LGRASQWHCEGQGFDPPRLHHFIDIAFRHNSSHDLAARCWEATMHWWFWVIWIGCFSLYMGLVLAIPSYDRVAVFILRVTNCDCYPLAIAIARLICERPSEWTHDRYHMRHPRIGAIWIANKAYGLHIETEVGDWTPSKIERRIIREAVDWRIRDYVRNRIAVEMQRHMLSGS
jgi:hypothetical protein